MNDTEAALDGLSIADLQAGRRALYEALMNGTTSVQFPDGTRVQYRTPGEIQLAMKLVDSRLAPALAPEGPPDPRTMPIRSFIVRPGNGYR